MFGMTPSELVQSGGAPPISGELPDADRPLGGLSTQGVQSAYTAARFGSGLGLSTLMEQHLQERSASYKAATGEDLPVYYRHPDLADAVDDKTLTPSSDANFHFGGNEAQYWLDKQRAVEQQVADYNQQNPGNPLPTARDIVNHVQQQATDINAQAALDTANTPGVNLPFNLGKVTLSNLAGSGAGTMTLMEHPYQTVAIGLAGPAIKIGGAALQASGAITNTLAARAASSFALFSGANMAEQVQFNRPANTAAGLGFSYPQALKEAALMGSMGAIGEGIAGAFGHTEPPPGSTAASAAEIAENLKDIAAKGNKTGQLAQQIISAKTPDEAAAAMAAAPLDVKSSLLDRVDAAPATNMRGGMQAMERENVVEQMKPDDQMTWEQHIERAQTVQNAIENDVPPPNYAPVNVTHIEEALNQIRVQDAAKSAAKGQEPTSLLNMIADNGGVVDSGGDIASMGGNDWHLNPKTGKPIPFQGRLIRGSDRINVNDGTQFSLDALAEKAWEMGYFPDHGENRPTVNDLLEKIDEELRGNKQYPRHETAPDSHVPLDQLRVALDKAGADLSLHSNQEATDLLNKHTLEFEEQRHQELFEEALNDELAMGEREATREAAMEARYAELDKIVRDQEKMMNPPKQSAIPGAEPITDRQLAERTMEKPLTSDKTQKPMDDGLFDVAGRGQEDLFANLKPDDIVPLGDKDSKGITLKEAMDSIKDDDDLVKAMTTCLL